MEVSGVGFFLAASAGSSSLWLGMRGNSSAATRAYSFRTPIWGCAINARNVYCGVGRKGRDSQSQVRGPPRQKLTALAGACVGWILRREDTAARVRGTNGAEAGTKKLERTALSRPCYWDNRAIRRLTKARRDSRPHSPF